jgi:hypothetical protein
MIPDRMIRVFGPAADFAYEVVGFVARVGRCAVYEFDKAEIAMTQRDDGPKGAAFVLRDAASRVRNLGERIEQESDARHGNRPRASPVPGKLL